MPQDPRRVRADPDVRCGCHARQVEAPDLFDLVSAFDDMAVDHWLDGGWGVDCLLGSQSRSHGDVDVVLARTDLDRVREMLATRGFRVIRDWLPKLALRDDRGREVDLHPVDRTADGGGDQILLDGVAWHYDPPVEGSIDGQAIRCASAEDQLLMHQGYEPGSIDFLDVHKLQSGSACRSRTPFDGPDSGLGTSGFAADRAAKCDPLTCLATSGRDCAVNQRGNARLRAISMTANIVEACAGVAIVAPVLLLGAPDGFLLLLFPVIAAGFAVRYLLARSGEDPWGLMRERRPKPPLY